MFANSIAEIDWTITLANLERIFTILAIFFGGIGAYYKFIKGRIFRPRLEIKVSGSVSCQNNLAFLVTTAQLKNVGLTKVGIRQKGTALEVLAFDDSVKPLKGQLAKWRFLGLLTVFEDHQWIESGETVEDQQLFVLPGCNYKIFLLKLRIVTEGGLLTRFGDVIYERLKHKVSESWLDQLPSRIAWKAKAVVTLNQADGDTNLIIKQVRGISRFWRLLNKIIGIYH